MIQLFITKFIIFWLCLINIKFCYGAEVVNSDIQINANRVEYTSNNLKAVAEGEVNIFYYQQNKHYTLTCNKMECNFDKSGRIINFTAYGNVKLLVLEDNKIFISVNCEKTIYNVQNQQGHCYGEVKISSPQYYAEGDEGFFDVQNGIGKVYTNTSSTRAKVIVKNLQGTNKK